VGEYEAPGQEVEVPLRARTLEMPRQEYTEKGAAEVPRNNDEEAVAMIEARDPTLKEQMKPGD
jgi:hypothetical protein